jgi:hypothetical protein
MDDTIIYLVDGEEIDVDLDTVKTIVIPEKFDTNNDNNIANMDKIEISSSVETIYYPKNIEIAGMFPAIDKRTYSSLDELTTLRSQPPQSRLETQPRTVFNFNNISEVASIPIVDYSDFSNIKKVGEGAFGEVVVGTYVGELFGLTKGETYAIKMSKKQSDKFYHIEQFFNAILPDNPSLVRAKGYVVNKVKPGVFGLIFLYIRSLSIDVVFSQSTPEQNFLQRFKSFVDGVVKALKVLHNANIVHRDIKPDNILVNRLSSDKLLVFLIDYGVSCVNISDIRQPT